MRPVSIQPDDSNLTGTGSTEDSDAQNLALEKKQLNRALKTKWISYGGKSASKGAPRALCFSDVNLLSCPDSHPIGPGRVES